MRTTAAVLVMVAAFATLAWLGAFTDEPLDHDQTYRHINGGKK